MPVLSDSQQNHPDFMSTGNAACKALEKFCVEIGVDMVSLPEQSAGFIVDKMTALGLSAINKRNNQE